MIRTLCCLLPLLSTFVVGPVVADDAYRTDANPDENLPWYRIRSGVFPPEGSGHYFAGELIRTQHTERKFLLRIDRTDAQRRGNWDQAVALQMLPYGTVRYHGATAALKDVPIGTHMHGLFYARDPDDKTKPYQPKANRLPIEAPFDRCLRLEDDFSYRTRRREAWRVDEINLAEKTLVATLMRDGEEQGKPETFDLIEQTRVWQGRSVVTPEAIAPGQLVQFNITWATLYGPGRILELWIDEKSRELATEQQRAVNRHHIRERGLPGYVTEVDNQNRILTVTLFDNVDRSLFEAVTPNKSAAVVVAEDTLLTYDPVNDRKSGPILEVNEIPKEPGSSGIQLRVQPNLLLEGYRPNRVVRVYPSGWSVIALPAEEQLFGNK